MHVVGIADARARTARLVMIGAVGVLLAGLGACGSNAPPAPLDPATQAYCDTVVRAQAEQSAPEAGRGGVRAAAEATRRRLADLVRTAPPEVAADWRTVQELTERSLVFLEATRGDPAKIDRPVLERLRRASEPAQARITAFSEQRCGVTFGAPG